MSNLFNKILFIPLFNFLILLYNSVAWHDLGLAVIVLTIIIRVILFPLFHRSLKHQRKLQKLTPHIKRIQEEHKNDKEKQAQALMALYREHGVNPLSQFYLLLIQFPILAALYRVALAGISSANLRNYLYPSVAVPTDFTHNFLGLVDLSGRSVILAVIAGVIQYFQAATALPKPPAGVELSPTDRALKNSLFFMVGVTFFFAYAFPAVIALYLATTTLFTFLQQLIVNKQTEEDIEKGKEWRRKSGK
ncbi:MAG: YidC/Oxa1 family membrane protein insertase [Patescibacteria group bacterium]|nr:YidC/Oxa1 family membrane protein insertase [Patescibacteria group bacterium]